MGSLGTGLVDPHHKHSKRNLEESEWGTESYVPEGGNYQPLLLRSDPGIVIILSLCGHVIVEDGEQKGAKKNYVGQLSYEIKSFWWQYPWIIHS